MFQALGDRTSIFWSLKVSMSLTDDLSSVAQNDFVFAFGLLAFKAFLSVLKG